MAHVITDRSNNGQGCLDVKLGTRQHLAQRSGIQSTAAQIDPGNHPVSLG